MTPALPAWLPGGAGPSTTPPSSWRGSPRSPRAGRVHPGKARGGGEPVHCLHQRSRVRQENHFCGFTAPDRPRPERPPRQARGQGRVDHVPTCNIRLHFARTAAQTGDHIWSTSLLIRRTPRRVLHLGNIVGPPTPQGWSGGCWPTGRRGRALARCERVLPANGAARARGGVGLVPYGGSFSDPPTQGEMQDFAAWVESSRAALVR